MKVGSIGTLHALGLAKEKAARFVLASTSETYGDPKVHPQPEDYWGHVNPVGPRGVYDEAKRFAEALTVAYRTAHGTDTAVVRIFNTYGPRMRADDGRAIPTFLRQARSGQPLTVAGDGSQTRSVCYVDDTVSGVLAVAASSHDWSGQHRLPRGDDRPGAGGVHSGCHRFAVTDRVHRPAGGRSRRTPPGHQPDLARARLVPTGELGEGAGQHDSGARLQ